MRPFPTHWTREANCTSVGISVWLCCYFRRSRLPFYTPIQASWCAVFVWPTSASTLHSQRRTVASFKEVLCWLCVSSQENEGCCPVEGRDGLCFFEAHPGIPPPTPQWGQNWNTDHGLLLPRLCFIDVSGFFYFFFRIYKLWMAREQKTVMVRRSLCLDH